MYNYLKFELVEGDTLENLGEKVQALMDEGWTKAGYVEGTADIRYISRTCFIQLMKAPLDIVTHTSIVGDNG